MKRGYTVASLTPAYGISYGNSANPRDLSNYDVFVVPEPDTVFTTAESTAIFPFVAEGGGLIAVADHINSDRARQRAAQRLAPRHHGRDDRPFPLRERAHRVRRRQLPGGRRQRPARQQQHLRRLGRVRASRDLLAHAYTYYMQLVDLHVIEGLS